mmetsp:Transcript_104444/g.301105  ORF Transcript_104444/g.301105 Transcript_104444/m.301105 type:complete len:382 (+) Transcript_104444:520-1665(+)
MNPSGAENNLGEGALLHTIDATIEQMKASEAVAEQTRQELAALLAEKEEFISEREAELDQIERVSGENIRLKAEVATIKEQFKAKTEEVISKAKAQVAEAKASMAETQTALEAAVATGKEMTEQRAKLEERLAQVNEVKRLQAEDLAKLEARKAAEATEAAEAAAKVKEASSKESAGLREQLGDAMTALRVNEQVLKKMQESAESAAVLIKEQEEQAKSTQTTMDSLVGTLKGSQKMVADLEGDLTQMRGELDRERLTTQQQKRLAEELKTELTEALTTLALERLDNKRLSSSMQEELEYAQKYNSELEATIGQLEEERQSVRKLGRRLLGTAKTKTVKTTARWTKRATDMMRLRGRNKKKPPTVMRLTPEPVAVDHPSSF